MAARAPAAALAPEAESPLAAEASLDDPVVSDAAPESRSTMDDLIGATPSLDAAGEHLIGPISSPAELDSLFQSMNAGIQNDETLETIMNGIGAFVGGLASGLF